MNKLNVLIWNENEHERIHDQVAAIYPDGIHGALAKGLNSSDLNISIATMDMANQGVSNDGLDNVDVLIWWGHLLHHEVEERLVSLVVKKINAGMGFVALHSAHHSQVFQRLMGTNCNLSWREGNGGERVRVWSVSPAHPIAKGIAGHIDIPADEMYGEPFNIPKPDDVVFINWYQGGEVFRSGCTWQRGRGRVFHFSPGHETFPIYFQPDILQIIGNGVRWAAAPHSEGHDYSNFHRPIPLEEGAPQETLIGSGDCSSINGS